MDDKITKRDTHYLAMAFALAIQSKAIRKKIGALIVKNTNGFSHIISEGVNGTPPDSELTVEDESGMTRAEVLHAEENAINKAKALNVDLAGSTLYVTCSPCPNCCNLIKNSGIKRLIYSTDYKNMVGLNQLVGLGIEVIAIPFEEVQYILGKAMNKQILDYSGWLRYCGFSEQQINHRIVGHKWKDKGSSNV